jgi:hypothetical protein
VFAYQQLVVLVHVSHHATYLSSSVAMFLHRYSLNGSWEGSMGAASFPATAGGSGAGKDGGGDDEDEDRIVFVGGLTPAVSFDCAFQLNLNLGELPFRHKPPRGPLRQQSRSITDFIRDRQEMMHARQARQAYVFRVWGIGSDSFLECGEFCSDSLSVVVTRVLEYVANLCGTCKMHGPMTSHMCYLSSCDRIVCYLQVYHRKHTYPR